MTYIIIYLIICFLLSLIAALVVTIKDTDKALRENSIVIGLMVVLWPLFLFLLLVLGLAMIFSIPIYIQNEDD